MTPKSVLDTSVAIDLHRGGLFDAFFRLPATYLVPDVMYVDELEQWFGPSLLTYGLVIQELNDTEVLRAREFMRRCPSLSVPDAYALALAAERQHTLLAGAKDIRELGKETGVEVRGVFHIFDLIEEANLLPPASLHTCLTLIVRSRTYLPKDEVEARLARYSGR